MAPPLTHWREAPPPWAREKPAGTPPATGLELLAGEVLERCRGDGPANCVARCPLGVDARGYVQLTREGRFREALQRVRERLPFPGILGYVCTHPCESTCKRIDDDRAVRIRDLKRFLAEWEEGEPQHVLDREADLHLPVAVVGGGPAGLLAAHDLRRRGYEVTLFERRDRIGGCLTSAIPAWRLPPSVVERDLSVIAALGVQVRTAQEVGRDLELRQLVERHCAVVLAAGLAPSLMLSVAGNVGLQTTPRDTIRADPLTCETGVPGVFAAGDSVSGPSTVIDALALGRRAAESVHRYLAGAPMRRDRAADHPGRLLWRLSIPEWEREVREHTPLLLERPAAPLTFTEAQDEAARCLDCHCDACVRDCDFLEANCTSPRDLARRVTSDLDEARTMVYSCALCSLCAELCPERLDIGAMLLEARRELVQAGRGPLRAHDRVVTMYRSGMSRALTLVMPEPGRRKSRRLFFPGCALVGLGPDHAVAVYDELRRHFSGVGVLLQCCGAPAEALGMAKEARLAREAVLRHAESVGAEELLVLCPSCAVTLHACGKGLKITTAWEALRETWTPPRVASGKRVTIHDPCRARHDSGLQEAVRALVRATGAEIEELGFSREKTRCCGSGGAIQPIAGELSRRFADRCVGESSLPIVTACSGCRTALASRGKETVHLWDLLLAPDRRAQVPTGPRGGVAGFATRMRAKWAFRRLRPLVTE